MAKKDKETEVKAAPKFTKKQFVTSMRFARHRDIINVLLTDGEEYTIEEVETIVANFFKSKKTK